MPKNKIPKSDTSNLGKREKPQYLVRRSSRIISQKVGKIQTLVLSELIIVVLVAAQPRVSPRTSITDTTVHFRPWKIKLLELPESRGELSSRRRRVKRVAPNDGIMGSRRRPKSPREHWSARAPSFPFQQYPSPQLFS
jgi:hypothetical protein